MITLNSVPFFDENCDSIQLNSGDKNQVSITNSQGFIKFELRYTEENEKNEAIATCLLTYILKDFVYQNDTQIVDVFFNPNIHIGIERVFITSEIVTMLNNYRGRIRIEILNIVK
jgi:hypothetical protein